MKFTENMLTGYAQPLSQTEDNQCKNAIRMISDSLKKLGFTDDNAQIKPLYPETYSYSLELRQLYGDRKIKIFIQGSYANNTNVRTQSDVDVAIIQEDTFTTEYRSYSNYPQSDSDYGFKSVPSKAKIFKDEVESCLKDKFGSDVERKNKSIKIHGNTYRKDADTVPCQRYRDYRKDYRKDVTNYIGGVVITSDEGERIINYPEQHIANGKEKNNNTNYHYKKMVRIMKKMRYLMEEDYRTNCSKSAKNVSSFMLESLLWNIPDEWYLNYCGKYRKVFAFSQMISYIKNHINEIPNYKEANGIKPLCENQLQINNLLDYIDNLSRFYEYE